MTRAAHALVALFVLLSGCASQSTDTGPDSKTMGAITGEGDPEEVPDFHLRDVSQGGAKLAAELSLAERARYVIDAQATLPVLEPVVLDFAGSVTPDQCGWEAPQDAGGTRLAMAPLGQFDFGSSVPDGMPVEVRSKLVFNPDVGSQADLDLWVQLPGVEDGASTLDDGAWNSASYTFEKRRDVTAGSGEPMLVGVECSEFLGGPSLDYAIQVELVFARNVLTPHLAYQIPVPTNTTQLLFASAPTTAGDPVRASILVTAPSGVVMHHNAWWNDTADRLRVPVREAGTYTFYADEMSGGFLTVLSDWPLPAEARGIAMAAPAVVEMPAADFDSAAPPLLLQLVWPEQSINGATTVTVSSARGEVLREERIARVDAGGHSLGLSNDHVHRVWSPWNLQSGAYSVAVEGDYGAAGNLVLRAFYSP